MHPIRRDSIPPRSPARLPSPHLDDYANRRNEQDYGGTLDRFMRSDAMVWEITYNTGTHTAYTIQSSFAQARKRLGMGREPIIAVRGERVYLAKPGWKDATPAPRADHKTGTPADRARVRMMVTDALIDFAESDEAEAVVTIDGDQTALYHALHYQRGRLTLSVTIARDGDRIVLRRRG